MDTQMYKEINEQPRALRDCRSFNEGTCKAIAKEFKDRNLNYFYFVARGTSDHAGIYGKYVFETLVNIPFCMGAASPITLYGGKPNFNGAAVIALSQSGMAADALEVIREANRQGQLTIAVTNNEESPLAKESKYHLFCNAGLESALAATKTFTTEAQLMLMLADAFNGGAQSAMLDEIPVVIEKTLARIDDINDIAKQFATMESCYILARGINFAVAVEAALKTQETCYVSAKAFPISDFHHGPFALVDDKSYVFVYTNDGKAFKDGLEMLDKLESTCCTRVVISPDDAALAKSEISFKAIKASSDYVQFFANAAFAQCFAQCLALAKGMNPDTPRGLNKVTITK